uniref:Carboxypeptidase n=1 Tax=Solanum lycopersicum TaxID=4081 RepID=A0A3Q7G9P3_SOLLC
MDFKFLSFLIFHYFLINSSTIYASLPFPNDSLPTKSGYLRVNDTTSSAIFYTFYEAQNLTTPLSQTPLLIWLQGGPGCSSMLGNFYELCPWRVSSSHRQKIEHVAHNPNNGSWNRIFGLLFLDNPIGVGFSIAATPEEIPRNQKGVAKHLYIAIKKFIELNESFKDRPIYIAGESYAGKYVPAIGYQVLKKNW